MKSRNDRYSDSRNIERENYFVVIKRDPSVTCPARYDRPRGGGAQLTFLSRSRMRMRQYGIHNGGGLLYITTDLFCFCLCQVYDID